MRNEAGDKPSLGPPADGLLADVHASLEAHGGPEELFDAAVWRATKAIESMDEEDLLPCFLSIGRCVDGFSKRVSHVVGPARHLRVITRGSSAPSGNRGADPPRAAPSGDRKIHKGVGRLDKREAPRPAA